MEKAWRMTNLSHVINMRSDHMTGLDMSTSWEASSAVSGIRPNTAWSLFVCTNLTAVKRTSSHKNEELREDYFKVVGTG